MENQSMPIYIIAPINIHIYAADAQMAEPHSRRRGLLVAKLKSVCSRMCSLLSNLVSLARFINNILMLCQFIGEA